MSRKICLLRGAPGAGKSTWIKENNLEQYTLSPKSYPIKTDIISLRKMFEDSK